MNVIEVGGIDLVGEFSGVAYTVSRLSDALRREGAHVQLHTTEPGPAFTGNYPIHVHPKLGVLSKLGVSPVMKRALNEAATKADIIHSHGMWTMPTVYPASAVRGKASRLMTSPHGTLSPWSLQWRAARKRIFWFLAQRRALRACHCLHAHAESEYQDIRRVGLRAPVAIIPTGIELGPEVVRSESGPRRLLYLSRVHPKKGIDLLLQSWTQIEPRFPDWELRIVGKEDEPGYEAKLHELSKSLGHQRVSFGGYIKGKEGKLDEFTNAHLFILPTHSDNFAVAVAEALAIGLPAIVTKGAPWSGLEKHNCGWWIEQGVDSITECLKSALSLPSAALDDKGRLGRQWMEREFSWQRVGRMMFETYSWLIGGGAAPAWVRNN